ncbi:BsuBI/PstI family type II restriction endonuclease [Gloeothece citriformis]|uniref:BsuBI/PstI family type II restriction endonuclease n=1 Tax=Gloeothece citriformis TaxID=2546356 RepID=UPI000173C44A|nr:BsuBI/PstI family type II restriction endonuclease [Gloeothece citriformis]
MLNENLEKLLREARKIIRDFGLTEKKDFLKTLKINVNQLEKSIQMPDVILYRSEKNTLFIVEAVKTGGEINVERRDNLLKLFEGCTAKICFVNAFESFKDLKKLLKAITWETHAWLADNPTHLIHFNGDKFWFGD